MVYGKWCEGGCLTHQRVGLVEVVPPVRADGLLPADVPHVQLEAVVHQRLDVEALYVSGEW